MVNEDIIFEAIEKDELKLLLRGDEPYRLEPSQYAPCAEVTDVGKILSKIIYKVYKIQPSIKQKVEDALLEMLSQTNFDVYVVILYVLSQLFKEKNGLSPFKLNMEIILLNLSIEIKKRKDEFRQGIVYPSGFRNSNAWNEIERFNCVAQEEYDIKLF